MSTADLFAVADFLVQKSYTYPNDTAYSPVWFSVFNVPVIFRLFSSIHCNRLHNYLSNEKNKHLPLRWLQTYNTQVLNVKQAFVTCVTNIHACRHSWSDMHHDSWQRDNLSYKVGDKNVVYRR